MNFADIDSEPKDGLVVIDGAIFGVFSIQQSTALDELASNLAPWTRLVSETSGVVGGVIPIAPICLSGGLGEFDLLLSPEAVIGYSARL